MGNLWLKIRIWTKAILLAVVLLYVLLFSINNMRQVSVWVWFGSTYSMSLLLVIFITLVLGVLGTLLTRTMVRTVRQVRQARERSRIERLEREHEEMKAKAQMLQMRPEPDQPKPQG